MRGKENPMGKMKRSEEHCGINQTNLFILESHCGINQTNLVILESRSGKGGY